MDTTNNAKTNSIITYKGLKKLQDELEDLKVVKRAEIAQKIKEAREQGDLSENAEYDAAKEEQAKIEGRIEEIESLLKHVEVVDEDDMKKGRVSVGSTVKILDVEMNEELTYQIVGATEASIEEDKISNESPVGKALIGAKKGDSVKVETPAGLLEFKVLSIKNS
ncbi:MAG: transcription elongation factor GreA [Lachnospiraceae bacterium]|nr:transcription elongation factor GreA [Lachnospiraceae bacterium]